MNLNQFHILLALLFQYEFKYRKKKQWQKKKIQVPDLKIHNKNGNQKLHRIKIKKQIVIIFYTSL